MLPLSAKQDAQCSTYFVDTNADGSIAQRQAVVLRLSSDMESLETEDGVVLTRLPQVRSIRIYKLLLLMQSSFHGQMGLTMVPLK